MKHFITRKSFSPFRVSESFFAFRRCTLKIMSSRNSIRITLQISRVTISLQLFLLETSHLWRLFN
ncbi:hypothetical protein BDFB_013404 [Asbolus verrucosus]|uniref:Uncharacterized protein n=1 Tax=Asbolus verrucosus TaxID=1661398 RepID=A0A482VDC2_ASBVE|nr:hypothetical protein BDFB_013404 [Asbolus verrucosus]